ADVLLDRAASLDEGTIFVIRQKSSWSGAAVKRHVEAHPEHTLFRQVSKRDYVSRVRKVLRPDAGDLDRPGLVFKCRRRRYRRHGVQQGDGEGLNADSAQLVHSLLLANA